MIISCLVVGLGGFLGAVSRMLLGKYFIIALSPFWSICIINCIGCFAFGFIAGLPGLLDDRIKDFLLVGFLGSFTTYSTYAFLNLRSLSSEVSMTIFFTQILVQTFAGLLLLFLGLKAANYF